MNSKQRRLTRRKEDRNFSIFRERMIERFCNNRGLTRLEYDRMERENLKNLFSKFNKGTEHE